MIRKLQHKFILINMTLMVAMLLVIFGLVFHFTWVDLDEEMQKSLQEAALMRNAPPGRPGTMRPQSGVLCFTLEPNPMGNLTADGSDQYDLTDQTLLRKIWEEAVATGVQEGVLKTYNLRFYRGENMRYAFADLTNQQQTIQTLVKNCLLIGVAAFVALLLISVVLSRWAIRPVADAWKQQRQFVADASHELKTPLAVILTNAELLQSQEYTSTQKQKFGENILTMTRQMRTLVENLLELARADNGQTMQSRETFDMSAMVEEAALPFEPLYFENGMMLTTTVTPGISVTASRAHIKQVLEILLDNGQKYGTEGEAVLKLYKQGKRCVLSLATPGQTLTAQQCQDIFRRFYRVDEARTRTGSYGLGLSIARRIVSEHRGKIWAEGKNGVNTFYVSLPE